MTTKRTTMDLINQFKSLREDKANEYEYSLYRYTTNDGTATFICKKHGTFQQATKTHLKGGQCPVCKNNKGLSERTNKFITSLSLRNDRGKIYDYSKVVYKNNSTKIQIICPEHGDFYQSPNNHITKNNDCPKCEKQKRIETCQKKYGVDHPMQALMVKQKLKDTFITKYGVDNPSKDPEIKQKISIANSLISSDDKEAFRRYVYKVGYYTSKVRHLVENNDKIGVKKFHLDHKYSKIQGFKDCIPPQIIGSVSNLEVIPWKDNVAKGAKCSIKLDDLIASYIRDKVNQ